MIPRSNLAPSLLLAILVLAPLPAHADTILRLSETATVMAHPDELDATVRADATAFSAAEAQRRVNSLMADAIAAAKAVPRVAINSGGYFVAHPGPTPQDRRERWQANQSLILTSPDGAALLKLVGELQQKGLAVTQLSWRLSDAAARAAQAEATRKAIAALRGRAEEAANLLDLRFGSFKEVRLDGAQPLPLRMMAPMAASAAAAPPPSAEATEVTVSATAEADIVLVPK
jgi:uncharacterized protein